MISSYEIDTIIRVAADIDDSCPLTNETAGVIAIIRDCDDDDEDKILSVVRQAFMQNRNRASHLLRLAGSYANAEIEDRMSWYCYDKLIGLSYGDENT